MHCCLVYGHIEHGGYRLQPFYCFSTLLGAFLARILDPKGAKLDPNSINVTFQLDATITQPWAQRAGKTQLVFECELLPYLLSLQLWAAVLPHSDLLVFIDNDSARRTLHKAFTKKAEGAHILLQAVVCEEHLSTRAAFLRVPTHSNIADGPSRDVFGIPLALGGRRVPLPEGCIAHALGLSEVLQGGEVTSLEPRRGEEHVEPT